MHTQTLLQALPKVDTLLSHPRFASYNAQVLKPIIQRQVDRARQALRQDLYGSSLAATHTELAACVMRVVREAGAENVSLDLIFGLSQMSARLLSGTLDAVCRMRPEHVSAYQLSVEEGSDLAAMVSAGRYIEAPEELCAAQYEAAAAALTEHLAEILQTYVPIRRDNGQWFLPEEEDHI